MANAAARADIGDDHRHETVREGSHYVRSDPEQKGNPLRRLFRRRPPQLILSDAMQDLRRKHDGMGFTMLQMVNRRLIDLSDGLIPELVVARNGWKPWR